MNAGDYAAIGREWKRLNPGRYDDFSDEKVGVVAIKKADIDLSPHFFLDTRTKHKAKQIALIMAQLTKMSEIQMGMHKHLHDMVELPKVLGEQVESRQELHALNLTTMRVQRELVEANRVVQLEALELQKQLIAIASQKGMDVTTLNTVTAHKLIAKADRKDFKKRQQMELEKHREMAKIDLHKKQAELELDRTHLLEARRISDELDRQNSRPIDIGRKDSPGLNAGSDGDSDA